MSVMAMAKMPSLKETSREGLIAAPVNRMGDFTR
jgi:hypothetical protein